jgi:hypothetical protein
MTRSVAIAIFGLLIAVRSPLAFQPSPSASDGPTPEAEYQKIRKDFRAARDEYDRLYQEAKSEVARDRLAQKFPYPDKFADRFLALARKYSKHSVALDSLSWILQQSGHYHPGDAPGAEKRAAAVVDLLIADHIQNDKLAHLLDRLPDVPSPAWEKLLRAILEQSTQRTTRGLACFRLGQYLGALAERRQAWQDDPDAAARGEKYHGPAVMKYARSRSVEQLSKEAEVFLERVVAKYGDIEPRGSFFAGGSWGDKSVGKMAEGELFEFRHLKPGKEAPEIAGEDLDGKRLKLSDYRGKVVVVVSWTT